MTIVRERLSRGRPPHRLEERVEVWLSVELRRRGRLKSSRAAWFLEKAYRRIGIFDARRARQLRRIHDEIEKMRRRDPVFGRETAELLNERLGNTQVIRLTATARRPR